MSAIESILRYFKRISRGLEYILTWLIYEYPRGLDFSLRVKYPLGNKSSFNGYARTSKRALRNLTRNLDIANKTILDIGSGKGAVICDLYSLGFAKSHGIEFNEELHKIAEKNIGILGLNYFCRSINTDAVHFTGYERYDMYFLFNPFNSTIYENVMEAIRNQIAESNKTRILIAYGEASYEAISKIDNITCRESGICPYRLTKYRIYQIN